tara:strand:- start:2866 stop:4179 length:1314 start_codon:yes stop_codon:yes gene_type:complete
MNIYIIFELKQRELLSKLLLSLEAASRGNDVFIGRINSFLMRNFFQPGIVHMKSITPGQSRINELTYLKKKNFLITSQDEENGFIDYDTNYKDYRYSKKTLSLVDKVFSWGPFDYRNICNNYPSFKKKIVKSGNPRIDFWRNDFKKFYKKIKYIKQNNYILFSTNFDYVCSHRSIEEEIKFHKNSGYFKRGLKEKDILRWAKNSKILFSYFKKLVIKISKKYKNKIIIVRPHPVDDIKKWKNHFKGFKNIFVNSDGFISDWIYKSKLVIHTGCTGGFEASARGKRTLSYYPIKIRHGHPYADILSTKIYNEKNIMNEINKAYLKKNSIFKINKNLKFIKNRAYNFVGKKSYIQIVDMWENIGKKLNNVSNSRFSLRSSFLLRDLRLKILRKKIGSHKFTFFDKEEVSNLIFRLKKLSKKFDDVKFEFIKSDILRIYK